MAAGVCTAWDGRPVGNGRRFFQWQTVLQHVSTRRAVPHSSGAHVIAWSTNNSQLAKPRCCRQTAAPRPSRTLQTFVKLCDWYSSESSHGAKTRVLEQGHRDVSRAPTHPTRTMSPRKAITRGAASGAAGAVPVTSTIRPVVAATRMASRETPAASSVSLISACVATSLNPSSGCACKWRRSVVISARNDASYTVHSRHQRR